MRTDAKTSKKIDEASKKGKKGKVKDVKRRVEGGEVGKWRDKGGLPRAHMGQTVENKSHQTESESAGR